MANYTKEQRYALIQKFRDMDVNGDNALSRDEIKLCCEQSKLPPEKVDVNISFFI